MQSRSAEHLFVVLKDGSAAAGLSNAMPGFGSQLDDQDIRNTVAYVQTLAKAQPAAPAADRSRTAGGSTDRTAAAFHLAGI